MCRLSPHLTASAFVLRKKVGALIQTSSREQLASQIRKISVLAVLTMEWAEGTEEERG